MLVAYCVLLAISIIPGYALCKVLDGTADNLRKSMLSPALGLLLIYGSCGIILISGLWTWELASAGILLLNTLAIAHIKRRVNGDNGLTQWQKLEAAMHGMILPSDDQEITDEVATQQWFQSHRSNYNYIIGGILVLSIAMLPLIQKLPFGVDWIGFAVLAGQIAENGSLVLTGTNEGFWTYPPAFPSLAAWLQETIGIDSGTAVFHLGHYTLAILIIGLAGAMDHHGSGGHFFIAVALGFGLFAKTYDSGFPTIASQLGLVVGLLVLLRPSSSRGTHHTRGFIIAVSCVALIHPTGAIYLGVLMAAHIVIGLSLRAEYAENLQRLLFACSILLTIAVAVSIVFLAPRMLNEAVFAEYGWQGGKPLLTYNGLLLVFAIIAGFKLRRTVEGRLLILCSAMLWVLSSIHIIEGLQSIPVLSLLSYTLYSMGLHAFHVPLAALIALWISPSTKLTGVDDEVGLLTIGWDPTIKEKLSKVLSASVLVGILLANAVVIQIAQHEELRPITNGDLTLREYLEKLPSGSVIYTENNHWGHFYDTPANVATTSIPTLGLVNVESTIHPLATSGILYDNLTKIQQLGIDYAISSPIGTIGWKLAESRYWSVLEEADGSRLWQFNLAGDSNQAMLAPVIDESCQDGCEMRLDPWRDHRFKSITNMNPDYRAFIEEGTDASLSFDLPRTAFIDSNACLFFESIGNIDSFSVNQPSSSNTIDASKSGWHSECFLINQTTNQLTIQLEWDRVTDSSSWINPTGLSGRGDRVFDVTGIRIHWLEIDI